MGNLNIAVVGTPGYAGTVGKKGTVTDMTFYDHKAGTDSFTLIEPSKYPEKLSSLFYSVAMSEFCILVVDKIDSFLGETIVMVDSLGIDKGFIILRNYIQPEQLAPILAGTCLEHYEYREEDPIKMREELIAMAKAAAKQPGEGTCGSCPVDSHFNVKGVGTVVLGSVIDGYFRKHDKMKVFPINREVILKSIQKHDIDADDGVKGDHVGLALRGIESDELDRGYVLTTDASVKMSRSVSGKASLVKYWPTPLKEGMVLHLGHWMQMVPCRVTAVDDGSDFRQAQVALEMDSDMIHKPGDRAILMYLEGGKLRVLGSIILPRPRFLSRDHRVPHWGQAPSAPRGTPQQGHCPVTSASADSLPIWRLYRMAKTRMNASMPIEATTVASIWILTSVTPASIGTATMRTIMAIIAAMAPLAISLDLMDVESSRSYNYIDGTADRHGYMWYAIT
ncbi:MAG: translation elongation factor 1 alpha-related protein [Candidatus Methanomethylophilaceae archaeon]|nr:translation elongation factor 1 alpha-related protein [Candidatus Methanomethylophilaceae archaeon]